MLVLLSSGSVVASTEVMTAESQKNMTPEQAIEKLKEGNNRFLSDKMLNRDYLDQVKKKALAQYPFAAIISCLDSRVPPEVVFDTNIGDLFVGRIAGNFVTTEMLGSLEFATAVAGAKLIVVLGHTECGAIKGICDDVSLGLLTATLAQLKPSVDNVKAKFKGKTSKDSDFVDAVTMDNITRTVHEIQHKSSVVNKLVANNQLAIVGARYNVETGAVEFL
tara:strand:- start:19421 stop:20080 length:660 start_codon:yes stop_codon:yes gene_type:complete